jgi:hypothetical protein
MGCPDSQSEPYVNRSAYACAAVLLLAACSQGGGKADPSDPAAGLDAEILKWRTEIEATHPVCRTKIEGKGCESFEVTCKGLRDPAADDAAKGVAARIVAAMRFSARTEDGSSGKPGSAFAEFVKTGGQWTRAEAKPVNPTTCAAF